MYKPTSLPIRITSIFLILNLLALPLLAQDAASSLTIERIEALKAEAQTDAKAMDKTTGYFIGGFFCGIIGFIIAVSSTPEAPVKNLVELPDAEKTIYADAYVAAAKKKRNTSACTGWLLGTTIALILLNSGSSSSS